MISSGTCLEPCRLCGRLEVHLNLFRIRRNPVETAWKLHSICSESGHLFGTSPEPLKNFFGSRWGKARTDWNLNRTYLEPSRLF